MTSLPPIHPPPRWTWHLEEESGTKSETRILLAQHRRGVCRRSGKAYTVTRCTTGAVQQAGGDVQGNLRVLFAAGGTGGHVYPAIALADEVRRLHPKAEILFVGTKDRMEWAAVPRAGYAITSIPAVALRRPLWSPSNLLLPFRLLHCIVECWKLVQAARPHLVVGTGGYVTGPVCLVAAVAGVPLAIQEQNAYAGITNRILARFANLVFVAFAAATASFPKHKCRVRGNPTRKALQRHIPKDEAVNFFIQEVADEKPKARKVVLVLGGSLGAKAINMAVAGMAMDMLAANPGICMIWQTGSRYFEGMVHLVGKHPRLALVSYLDRMDMAYAAADVVVARAGAITCSELLTTGTPSILIPSTNVAEDHQMKNAVAIVKAGAARLLPEKELDPVVLSSLVVETLKDEAALTEMMKNASKAASPNAAAVIAEEALSLSTTKNLVSIRFLGTIIDIMYGLAFLAFCGA